MWCCVIGTEASAETETDEFARHHIMVQEVQAILPFTRVFGGL